jgi:hypothetical protein
VLLIDDADSFVGQDSYPTVEELSDHILAARPGSRFEVKDGIIRISL